MSTIGWSPAIRFFGTTVLALAVVCCVLRASSQEDWREFAFRDQPAPGDEILPGPNVWVEGVFVEMGKDAVRNIESGAAFKLSPPNGKVILTADEKERLLAAIDKTAGARIVASLALLTICGRQAQSEIIDELNYPTEYKSDDDGIRPGDFEIRDLGAIFNVTATILEDGRIALVMLPEVTSLTGWKAVAGTDVIQPVCRTWNRVSTVIIPDGATVVPKESLTIPLYDTEPEAARSELVRKGERFTAPGEHELIRHGSLQEHMKKRDFLRAEIAGLQAYIERLSAMTDDERVNATQDNQAVCELAVELADQEAMLQGLLQDYGAEHPQVKGQKNAVATLKRKLYDLANGVLESKKVKLAALREHEKALDRSISEAHTREGAVRPAPPIEPLKVPGEIGPRPIAEKPSSQRPEILTKLETVIPAVKLEDAGFKEAVDLLSCQAGVTIVTDPIVFSGPQGERVDDTRITLSLKNVPLKEVLKYILKKMNLKYIVEDYAILIAPADYVPPESLETEIFRLPRGLAPDAGETIKDFLLKGGVLWPKGSNIVYNGRTGTLVVTNTPDALAYIREMVFLYDRPAHRPETDPRSPKTLLTIVSAKIVQSE